MTWIQFSVWITVIYFFYYLVNILFDGLGSSRGKAVEAMSRELTFAEPVEAEVVAHEPDPPLKATGGNQNGAAPKLKKKPEPEVIGSGGVPLKTVFNLAQAEVIHYTKHVAY